MPDFDKWRSVNRAQGFSLFDYAHAILSTHQLPTDLLLATARMLWPEYETYGGMVFLKEQFSAARVEEHRKTLSKTETEYWVNLLCIDGLFAYSGSPDLSQDEEFARIVSESWRAKLRADFPDRSFDVKLMVDESVGDVLVTFTSAD